MKGDTCVMSGDTSGGAAVGLGGMLVGRLSCKDEALPDHVCK